MATPPQAQMKAPSGPRNPQMDTETSRSGECDWNVVERIRYPHAMPASTPHR